MRATITLCNLSRNPSRFYRGALQFGSPDFATALMPSLNAAGVTTLIYRPERTRFSFRRHRLRRLHRKLALIDERIAFVGGINIVDDHDEGRLRSPRFDFAVRIQGPTLTSIHHAMHRLWEITAWVSLRRRLRSQMDCLPPQSVVNGTQQAIFLIRDNFRHRRTIERAYLSAILTAREQIFIANAYFLPGRRFRQALIRAARRGIRITLLLQGRIEYRLQHYATQALYSTLLNAGIKIFEYRNSFLHAKVAVVDGQWATVGSSNIDPFSLLLAKEANLVVVDQSFAAELQHHLDAALLSGATELATEQWNCLPLLSRALRWACLSFVRLLVGISGYGRQH